MTLRAADIARLEKFKRDLELLGLRFPIAELAVRMKMDKGNISAYLKGKKPISDNFLQRFHEEFSASLAEAGQLGTPGLHRVGESASNYERNVDLRLEISNLKEEMELQLKNIEMHLQAFQSTINAMNAMIEVTVKQIKEDNQSVRKTKTKASTKKKSGLPKKRK